MPLPLQTDLRIIELIRIRYGLNRIRLPDIRFAEAQDRLARSIAIRIRTDHGKPVLTLRGRYVSTCMKIKQTRTYVSEGNVLVVQPIAEMKEGADCENKLIPFETKLTLEEYQFPLPRILYQKLLLAYLFFSPCH